MKEKPLEVANGPPTYGEAPPGRGFRQGIIIRIVPLDPVLKTGLAGHVPATQSPFTPETQQPYQKTRPSLLKLQLLSL